MIVNAVVLQRWAMLCDLTTFISDSHLLTLPRHPSFPTTLMLAVTALPRGFGCRPDGCGYIVPEASHPAVAGNACSGRIPMAVHRVVSCVEQSQQLFKRLSVALCKNNLLGLGGVIPSRLSNQT
jgi:hypothetical protein